MADMEKSKDIEKNSKPAKPAQKKPNIFARAWKGITRWFKDMKGELKKVAWPSRSQVVNNTIIVIICVIIVGIFIWIFDWLAAAVVKALLNLFS